MTNLSPAAQAVLDAFGKHPLHSDHISGGLLYGALPAALRAAAYIVAPAIPVCDHCCDRQSQNIRHKLLAIADELEGQ
jgi:hypothetical protein